MFSFRWNRPIIFERFRRKTIAHNTKRRRPRFRKETKAVFISIRYRKTSQTRDVKSHSTKRSVRKLAQPNRDSAFEQKTRFVPSRETSERSQNINFSYNQGKKQNNAQKVIFGTYSRSFWKFTVSLKKKAVFISFRYHKTSQTQDVKSQNTKRSLRELAQPKRDCAFEQKTRIVSSGEIWGSSQSSFFSYNQSNKPTRAQKDIFRTYSTSFWKVSILLKKQNVFYKYSILQDISNAGWNEPKY